MSPIFASKPIRDWGRVCEALNNIGKKGPKMNKIVSTDFITDDVQRLVPVDATATTPKNAAVAKLLPS